MSPREWRYLVEDIIEAIDEVAGFVNGMTAEVFFEDNKTQAAVERKFILIGEAARQMPETVKDTYPEIPWRNMKDMRNFAVHVYWAVESAVLWETIHEDLPELARQLSSLLDQEAE